MSDTEKKKAIRGVSRLVSIYNLELFRFRLWHVPLWFALAVLGNMTAQWIWPTGLSVNEMHRLDAVLEQCEQSRQMEANRAKCGLPSCDPVFIEQANSSCPGRFPASCSPLVPAMVPLAGRWGEGGKGQYIVIREVPVYDKIPTEQEGVELTVRLVTTSE